MKEEKQETFSAENARRSRIQSFLSRLQPALHLNKKNLSHYEELTLINFIPTHKKILIYPIKSERITEAGIIIPDMDDQENPINGIVKDSEYLGMIVSAAPDAEFYDGKPFTVGDLCIYAKHRETRLNYGTVELLMVSEFDIWGIVPDNAYHSGLVTARNDKFKEYRERLKTMEDIEKREIQATGK